jgi:stage V sporulation protein D (sporulation-specific penicillin-binding protein)
VDIARIGFGQSVAVTPIQLLTAVCAVVNGGNLMRPWVVKTVADAHGKVIRRGAPKVVGHAQKIFVAVESSICTSRPMTVS